MEEASRRSEREERRMVQLPLFIRLGQVCLAGTVQYSTQKRRIFVGSANSSRTLVLWRVWW